MSIPRIRTAFLSLAATALVACGGGPAAPTSGVPTVPPMTIPPLPSVELPSGLTIPSFSIPSFAPDPTIEQAFPTEIAGQPVTDVSSANFLTVLQVMGQDQQQIAEFMAGMQAINVDPTAVGFGSALVTLDEEPVQLQVVRFPGGNAGAALDILTRIDEPDQPPTLTTETIGGKTVTVATNPDDDVEYFYISGEWAWFLDNVERSHVETIFSALP